MKHVYLMTKNPGKLAAANSVFNKHNIEVRSLDFDIPEIQANTSTEIACYAVKEAYKKFKQPIIREDHSFFIDELGIPGPYMSYVEAQMPLEVITKILPTLKSRHAHFEIAAGFADADGNIKSFSFNVPVIIELQPRGDLADGWTRLFRFEDDTRTFAEYDANERLDVWNKNYEEIAKIL